MRQICVESKKKVSKCVQEKTFAVLRSSMTFYNSTEDDQSDFEVLIFLDLIINPSCALGSQGAIGEELCDFKNRYFSFSV